VINMPDIMHLIRIAAPAARIVPLVSSGQGFTQWWAEDVESDANGVVRLGFFNKATLYTLRPDGAATETRVTWRCETGREWSGTRLLFEMQPQGNETVVKFTHAGWENASDYFVSCNTTWGELMFRLKAAAEGKAAGPLFLRSSLAY
jgi:hypothetical protein